MQIQLHQNNAESLGTCLETAMTVVFTPNVQSVIFATKEKAYNITRYQEDQSTNKVMVTIYNLHSYGD